MLHGAVRGSTVLHGAVRGSTPRRIAWNGSHHVKRSPQYAVAVSCGGGGGGGGCRVL